ncbi:MAG: T9SS type A sorting domain-containing protein, partial [Bacteroidota bacterium]
YPVAGPPGIFEVTVNNVCYSSFNYIFINGDSSQTYGNETYPDTTSRTCLEPDGLGGFNRKYTRIDTNAVVLGFVYNKCDTIICGNFANATPAGPTALCQGGSVVLNANTGIGLTYQWLNNNTPIALATNNAFTANTSGSYRVIITNSSSCRDTSAAVNVTISPPPTATAVAATATNFCQGGSVVISANTGTGLTYQWLNNNAPIALATNSSLTANSSGSYRVMVTNASNCRDTSAAVSVTVHPLPVAIATAATATTFCQGGSVLINANTGIGLTYQWRNTGVNIPLATTSSFTASTSGSYDVAVTNNNGCIDSSSLVNVTVNPYPIAGVMLGDSLNLKIGNFYIYTLAQQPNHTYNWIVSKGIIVGGQNTNTATVQWSTNGSGFIRSIISNPQGCTDTSSKQVSIGNVGLNKLSTLRAFHVYPNPSNGSFTISMQAENATAVEMRLVNLLGQTVWSQSSTLQAGENELTVNAPLAPGMYTLIVDENNNRLQQKIIIK